MKTIYSNLVLSAGKPVHMFKKEGKRTWECNRWNVTVKNGDSGKSSRFTYYTGSAHKGLVNDREMRVALHCFLSDAQSGLWSFEDFCGEFGYDYDSREAYKTWVACKRAGEKLASLGIDVDELAEKMEEEEEF